MRKSNNGSLRVSGFLIANTHHSADVPYKSNESRSGRKLYVASIVNTLSVWSFGMSRNVATSKKTPDVVVL